MILIDTGFLVALAQPNDALHSRAVAWAKRINQPLIVTEYVLCETIKFHSKRPDRLRGQTLIREITSNPGYTIIDASPRLFLAGFELHRSRLDKDWSLTDCVSFHLIKEHSISEALAYDEHFLQAGFIALLRKDPV
jgi:predicted nucleic acid-binding protein